MGMPSPEIMIASAESPIKRKTPNVYHHQRTKSDISSSINKPLSKKINTPSMVTSKKRTITKQPSFGTTASTTSKRNTPATHSKKVKSTTGSILGDHEGLNI